MKEEDKLKIIKWSGYSDAHGVDGQKKENWWYVKLDMDFYFRWVVPKLYRYIIEGDRQMNAVTLWLDQTSPFGWAANEDISEAFGRALLSIIGKE